MKATKRERKNISKWLWEQGHGSKHELAEKIGCHQSEITRLLNGGTISEEKLTAIRAVVAA